MTLVQLGVTLYEPRVYPALGVAVNVRDVPALTNEGHAEPPQVIVPFDPALVVMVYVLELA